MEYFFHGHRGGLVAPLDALYGLQHGAKSGLLLLLIDLYNTPQQVQQPYNKT